MYFGLSLMRTGNGLDLKSRLFKFVDEDGEWCLLYKIKFKSRLDLASISRQNNIRIDLLKLDLAYKIDGSKNLT